MKKTKTLRNIVAYAVMAVVISILVDIALQNNLAEKDWLERLIMGLMLAVISVLMYEDSKRDKQ